MNRAETKFALDQFYDRLVCSTVADATLAQTYVETLSAYLANLEEDFEPIDAWSVEEYERVAEYTHNNFQWIANPDVASNALADAHASICSHCAFLIENGLLPEYLLQRPNPSFQRTPDGAAEFAR